MSGADNVLEMRDITIRFGDLVANDAVNLHLESGEVLALLGENGAGKTTLMNVLFGQYAADSGEVRVFGDLLPSGKPRAAIEAGLGMVHQHFTLAGNLTVLENIVLGTEPLFRLARRDGEARKKLAELSERFGLPVDPDARISSLSVGERQRVEILKALYRDARILILDEPTAVLARPEAERLFETLRVMTAEGLSVIFISHKLHEVMAGSDRVTVLRGGKVVAERQTSDTSPKELAELMVGKRVSRPKRSGHPVGQVVVEGSNLSLVRAEATKLDKVSFSVSQGEILAIIGVSGNGQAALGDVLAGLAKPTSGSLTLSQKDGASVELSNLNPRARVKAGVGRVPEDRHAEGVVGELAVWENAIAERLNSARFSVAGFVRAKVAKAHTSTLIREYDIRGAAPPRRTRLLSGGNMQKLILGRVLESEPRFILANQPTRGLDEGAIAAVHEQLLAARQAGAAIMLITEDLEEATALADRFQAMVKGRMSSPVQADDVDAATLGLMMAGQWEGISAHRLEDGSADAA